MYKTEDYGLFLGFMTMPFGKEKDFKEFEIDNLFAQYKEEVHHYLLSKSEEDKIFEQDLFKPKVYCLFGKFDLAVLSLVDSFGLATRSFHPFSPLMEKKLTASNKLREKEGKEKYTPQNYTFHVVSGLSPDLKAIDPQEDSLLEKARATFLNPDKNSALPFIGISSFKFNNALVTGGGGELIDLAVRAIQKLLIKKQQKKGVNLNYLISYSFAWHELSIIFFSDSYDDIVDEVFKIRELIVQNLDTENEKEKKLYQRVIRETLLHKVIQEDTQEKNLAKLYSAHLFVHSNTVLGYDSDIFIEDDASFDKQFKGELNFKMRWDLKPGHLSTFSTELEAHREVGSILKKGRVTAGRGDYAYVLKKDAITNFRKILKVIVDSDLKKHVRTVTTVPEFPKFTKQDGKLVDLSNHFLVHDHLSEYQFTLQQIVVLRKFLKKLRIPKIIQEKVTNMYTVYNDGVSDPILYNYFIELRPYLEEVFNLLEELSLKENPGTVDRLTIRLDDITCDYEMAYQNRFGQSYIMNEITDYNLMFNGGIQQLVSLFDGAYKSLASLFGEGEYSRSMAYVAGISNTKSELLAVRLNYFHLYQPEFFAATATHEAINFILHRYHQDETEYTQDLHRLFRAIDNDPEIETLERKQLHYFLVDVVNYYTTFAEDFELFAYWTWSVYLQMAIAYEADGRLDQGQFNMLFTRLYLLASVVDEKKYFPGKLYPPFNSNDLPLLEDAWDEAFGHARREVTKIQNKFHELLGTAQNLAGAYLYADLISVTMEEPIDQAVFLAEKNNNITPNTPFEEVVARTRQSKVQHLANQILEKFKEGKVFSFANAREDQQLCYAQDSFFLQALLLAYLKLIKSLNKDEINLLPRSKYNGRILRDEMGNINKEQNLAQCDLWFDPYGGLFTTKTSTRVAYFKYRSVFLKTLWGFSAKRKIKLFTGILREE